MLVPVALLLLLLLLLVVVDDVDVSSLPQQSNSMAHGAFVPQTVHGTQSCGNNNTSTTSIGASGTTTTTPQPQRGTINALSSPPQQYNPIRSKPNQTKPNQSNSFVLWWW